jgi:hypothetical protein
MTESTSAQRRGYYVLLAYIAVVLLTVIAASARLSPGELVLTFVIAAVGWAVAIGLVLGLLDRWGHAER